jgi:hypothetical protein
MFHPFLSILFSIALPHVRTVIETARFDRAWQCIGIIETVFGAPGIFVFRERREA